VLARTAYGAGSLRSGSKSRLGRKLSLVHPVRIWANFAASAIFAGITGILLSA
jgi:hypothetical protein